MSTEAKLKEKIQKGHCPSCGPDRSADVVGSHVEKWDDEDSMVWSKKTWRILKCRGCETVFVQTTEIFSEDTRHWRDESGEWHEELDEKISHWPAPSRRTAPEWSAKLSAFDNILGSLFEDVYGALNGGLAVPAAVAMRTVFDRASEVLGVNSSLSFEKKLANLHSLGKISADEKDTLSTLVDAGSAAVHRGWRPKPAELEIMVLLTEAFLHRNFVLGDAAKELRKQVPKKAVKKNK